MKLAREIAEIADEKHSYSDDATGASGIDITAGQLESIIAAKLEPVREACGKITDCAARDRNEGCRFCSDASKCLDDLMDSLATLSEE